MDFIGRVIEWNKAAGNTDDRFNVRQTAMYIGLVLEEVSELLFSLEDPVDVFLADKIHKASMSFRNGERDKSVEACNRLEMLDATADILVVATGLAMSQGADVHGALDNVCASNESKSVTCPACHGNTDIFVEIRGYIDCETCNGRGWILEKDETGKIKKGPDYFKPSLEQFVCED